MGRRRTRHLARIILPWPARWRRPKSSTQLAFAQRQAAQMPDAQAPELRSVKNSRLSLRRKCRSDCISAAVRTARLHRERVCTTCASDQPRPASAVARSEAGGMAGCPSMPAPGARELPPQIVFLPEVAYREMKRHWRPIPCRPCDFAGGAPVRVAPYFRLQSLSGLPEASASGLLRCPGSAGDCSRRQCIIGCFAMTSRT